MGISNFSVEMIIILIAAMAVLIAICIITVTIRCKCRNRQTPQQSHPHFQTSTIPPNYGYTSSKADERSSWVGTFRPGQQVNTHIWETPLPEPSEGEYTLPASMKQQFYRGEGNAGSMMRTNEHVAVKLTQRNNVINSSQGPVTGELTQRAYWQRA